MKRLLATVFLALSMATTNAAAITYHVDRIIGDGTVVGTITTNGHLGLLTDINTQIENWSLTLTAPNLNSGIPVVIDQTGSVVLTGGAVTATPTELVYDFNLPGTHNLLFMDQLEGGVPTALWCLETSRCSSAPDLSEHIAIRLINGSTQALQIVDHSLSGEVIFATAVIPVPAAIWLFGSGLFGLFGLARIRR